MPFAYELQQILSSKPDNAAFLAAAEYIFNTQAHKSDIWAAADMLDAPVGQFVREVYECRREAFTLHHHPNKLNLLAQIMRKFVDDPGFESNDWVAGLFPARVRPAIKEAIAWPKSTPYPTEALKCALELAAETGKESQPPKQQPTIPAGEEEYDLCLASPPLAASPSPGGKPGSATGGVAALTGDRAKT